MPFGAIASRVGEDADGLMLRGEVGAMHQQRQPGAVDFAHIG